MAKKVLVIHASAGSGHRRAAQALQGSLQACLGANQVEIIDALDYTGRFFQWFYRDLYHAMLKRMPWVWANLFTLSEAPYMSPKKRRRIVRIISLYGRALVDYVRKTEPGLIVCTHFLPAEILMRAKELGLIDAPIHCVITDYYAHEWWLLPCIAQYYVASEAIARHIGRWSSGGIRCLVTGIPIPGDFSIVRRSPALFARLGLREQVPVVLLLGGSLGMGPVSEVYRSICSEGVKCQVIVVTGHNARLEHDLREISEGADLHTIVLGYSNNMHEL